MKNLFKAYGGLTVLILALVFFFASGWEFALAEDDSFAALRGQVPAQLDSLRARVNQAGGEDISLALLLGAQDEDARMVGATVLVYQQYPRERKMAVLLAASVKFNKEFYRLQEVSENSLKLALSQAPEEMYGVRETFQAVRNLLEMPSEQLRGVVQQSKDLASKNKREIALAETQKSLKARQKAEAGLKRGQAQANRIINEVRQDIKK